MQIHVEECMPSFPTQGGIHLPLSEDTDNVGMQILKKVLCAFVFHKLNNMFTLNIIMAM